MRLRIASIAAIGSLLLGCMNADSFAQAQRIPVESPNTAAHHLTRTGSLADSQVLRLAIGMRLRNPSKLHQLLERIYDPSSPSYGHYVSPITFRKQFGPTPAQVNTLIHYLRSYGLSVNRVAANRMIVDVDGKPSQVNRAFGVEMNVYRLGSRSYYAPDHAIALPSKVASLVEGVVGLDDENVASSHAQVRPASVPGHGGYTPEQIQNAYNYTSVYGNWRGRGQTIAVVTSGAAQTADVHAFDDAYGMSDPSLTVVPVDGGNTNANEETTIDVEWSHAIASSAGIRIYDTAAENTSAFTDAFNQVASDDAANVVTTSWGAPESQTPSSTIRADHAIFEEMAAQGQSVFAAAGDNGSSDGISGTNVDYPSSDSYVTACGGTTLSLSGSGERLSETAWENGGGGQSTYFGQPSWQYGLGIQADQARQTADIALNANPQTGYSFYYQGSWYIGGGTSFVAPEIAATFALINQSRAVRGESPIGQPNRSIYALGRSGSYAHLVYHDITSGSNGAFTAGSGYDSPTGWGSINAYYFINGLN